MSDITNVISLAALYFIGNKTVLFPRARILNQNQEEVGKLFL